MAEICNGYRISGNLADAGRKYEVYDANGSVLHTTDSKRKAMDYAESRNAGTEKPEPESDTPTPEQDATPEPKTDSTEDDAGSGQESGDTGDTESTEQDATPEPKTENNSP